jgi:hypothetical protein
VPDADPAGRLFGSTSRSSHLLIKDAVADKDSWSAARLHMHAEDEFSGGSFGSAKRNGVRVLTGTFSVRLLLEGPEFEPLQVSARDLDRLIALGGLQHLPVGGHKTRGAGFGRWRPLTRNWQEYNVQAVAAPCVSDITEEHPRIAGAHASPAPERRADLALAEYAATTQASACLTVTPETLPVDFAGTLKAASDAAAMLFGPTATTVYWWCEPAIDFSQATAPRTFGAGWPSADEGRCAIEEALFFTPEGSWRAARTAGGWRGVALREDSGGEPVTVTETPVRLHRARTRPRFSSAGLPDLGDLVVRAWYRGRELLGFTMKEVRR